MKFDRNVLYVQSGPKKWYPGFNFVITSIITQLKPGYHFFGPLGHFVPSYSWFDVIILQVFSALTSCRTEKCCHLVSAYAVSARRLLHLPGAHFSSWSIVHLCLFIDEGGASSSNSSSGRDPARPMSYGVPGLHPTHPVDSFLRMPGVFPSGSREAWVVDFSD